MWSSPSAACRINWLWLSIDLKLYPPCCTILFGHIDHIDHCNHLAHGGWQAPRRVGEMEPEALRSRGSPSLSHRAGSLIPPGPIAFPPLEEAVPNSPLDQQVAAPAQLACQTIVGVALGGGRPQVVLDRSACALVCVNGQHDDLLPAGA